jgi:nucleoid DNA-binding protein
VKITKSQLNKVIEVFLQTIKSGLEKGVKVALKDHFSLVVATSKETLKNNPRDRQQKLIIPAQKRVRIRVSDN